MIAGALKGVISQRLVRKICPHCRKAYTPTAEEQQLLGMQADSEVVFYRGEGCPECHHTGYSGRQAVFEILMLDQKLRKMISEGENAAHIKETALTDGFVTMQAACRKLVLAGVTGTDEAIKAMNSTVEGN